MGTDKKRKRIRVRTLILIAGALLVFAAGVLLGRRLRADSEADWMCQAAGLMERLDEVSAAEMAPAAKREAYLVLLGEGGQLADAKSGSARHQEGRKAFGSLFSSLVKEQIGTAEGGSDLAKYREQLARLSERRKTAPEPLSQRPGRKGLAPVQGTCEIETRGDGKRLDKEVKIRAVGYPLRGLLAKLSDKIGQWIEMPPGVSGLVHYSSKDWEPARYELFAILWPLGLSFVDEEGKAVEVVVSDPLYGASIGERVAVYATHIKPMQPISEGITSGHVLIDGHYLPPPYKVEVVKDAGKCQLLINAVVVREYLLKVPAPPAAQKVKLPKSKQFKDPGDLTDYAGDEFVKLEEKYGTDEAVKRMSAFLRTQEIVGRFEFSEGADGLTIEYKEGGFPHEIYLHDESNGWLPGPSGAGRSATDPLAQVFLDDAGKTKDSIEKCLEAGGLVVKTRRMPVLTFDAQEGDRLLRSVSADWQDAVGPVYALAGELFVDWDIPTALDMAWELFVNLEHVELKQSLAAQEAAPVNHGKEEEKR